MSIALFRDVQWNFQVGKIYEVSIDLFHATDKVLGVGRKAMLATQSEPSRLCEDAASSSAAEEVTNFSLHGQIVTSKKQSGGLQMFESDSEVRNKPLRSLVGCR